MKLTFTIQIDTDDKNVIVQQTTPATPVIQAVADCTQEKNEVLNSLKPTEVKPITEENVEEEKQEEEVKPIKRGRPLGSLNKVRKPKNTSRKIIEPLPDDQLIPADFDSKYVTITKEDKVPRCWYEPLCFKENGTRPI